MAQGRPEPADAVLSLREGEVYEACSATMQTKTANRHSQHAQAVVRYLQRRGAWTTRLRAGWGMRKGLPDILACWQGRVLAIEVKTGSGRLTPHQRRELEALRAAGAVVLVGDAPTVIRQLQAITQDPQPALWE